MKVLITGATGMIGKGVLLECLESDYVSEVISIGRRKTDIIHPKLTEIVHPDFLDFSPVKVQLSGVDAAYHCMGVSAASMPEERYAQMTYGFSMSLAKTLMEVNPQMTMIYVSGQGTDSTEKGRSMWARVKGKTENDLLKMGFRQSFAFRPGGIIPTRGIKASSKLYRVLIFWFRWLLHLIKFVSPNSIVDTDQIGSAMIQVSIKGFDKSIINPSDINQLSR